MNPHVHHVNMPQSICHKDKPGNPAQLVIHKRDGRDKPSPKFACATQSPNCYIKIISR